MGGSASAAELYQDQHHLRAERLYPDRSRRLYADVYARRVAWP